MALGMIVLLRTALVTCALLIIAVALVVLSRFISSAGEAVPTTNTTYVEGTGPMVGSLVLAWGAPIDDFTDASDRDLVWPFAEVDIRQAGLSPFTRIQEVIFTHEHGFWGWRGFTTKTR